jgi:hypothetical protein
VNLRHLVQNIWDTPPDSREAGLMDKGNYHSRNFVLLGMIGLLKAQKAKP